MNTLDGTGPPVSTGSTEKDSQLDPSALTPTEYLITEVMAARWRTGEHLWTFPMRPAITRALRSLQRQGFVGEIKSPDGVNWQVFMVDDGIAATTSPDFVIPILRKRDHAREHFHDIHEEGASEETLWWAAYAAGFGDGYASAVRDGGAA